MSRAIQSAPLAERFSHLLAVIGSEKFLKCEGLGNEDPFFVVPYDPYEANQMARVRSQLANRLSQQGVRVLELDLYDLVHEILVKEGDWEHWLEAEARTSKQVLKEELQGVLDSQNVLVPAIVERMAKAPYHVMFLSGAGEVFPYIRSHTVLHNLHKVAQSKPIVLFFPGEYEQSLDRGTRLDLFAPRISLDEARDDKYYRAFNIFERDI